MKAPYRIFVALLSIALLAALAVWLLGSEKARAPELVAVPDATRDVARFSWEFRDAAEMNLDGRPRTDVVLAVTYEDGAVAEHRVGTVDGGCAEIAGEHHEGDVSGTGKVQCYYAGLGQRYRIREAGTGYAVERQVFEEGVPDTVPAESRWEAVAQIEG